MIPSRTLMKGVWGAVIFLACLGVAVAARRALVLLKPGVLSSNRNPAADLDEHFATRPTLDWIYAANNRG